LVDKVDRVDAAWERRLGRPPESFRFDFGVGRVTVVFGDALVSYEAILDEPLLVVRDPAVEPPRSPGSLQLRAEGLWGDHNCETPLEHWSIGAEAFALAVAHVDDELGDRVAFGLDVEWEATGPPVGGEGSYVVPARVTGDVLVGREVLALDGAGEWAHTWRPPTR
jgi:hypothetical protein